MSQSERGQGLGFKQGSGKRGKGGGRRTGTAGAAADSLQFTRVTRHLSHLTLNTTRSQGRGKNARCHVAHHPRDAVQQVCFKFSLVAYGARLALFTPHAT
jgi:hypothetical protein